MKKFEAGGSTIYAEVIIDYKKEEVKILDPDTRYKIGNTDYNFSYTPILLFISIYILLICFTYFGVFGVVVASFTCTMVYLVSILLTPITKKYHELGQFLFNDFFKVKKYLVVSNIKNKRWVLPYDFKNIKFDVNLTKDYSKYINKIHIKPKDYFLTRWGGVYKNNREWEVVFNFDKVPKLGCMKITFI